MSLSRNPLAPARSAPKTYSSSSNVVSTITRVPAQRRVGGDGAPWPRRPSMRGIRTSMSTTSGACSARELDGRARRRPPRPRPRCRPRRRAARGSRRGRAPGRRRARRVITRPTRPARQPGRDAPAAARRAARPRACRRARRRARACRGGRCPSRRAGGRSPPPSSGTSTSTPRSPAATRTRDRARAPAWRSDVRERLLDDPVRRRRRPAAGSGRGVAVDVERRPSTPAARSAADELVELVEPGRGARAPARPSLAQHAERRAQLGRAPRRSRA